MVTDLSIISLFLGASLFVKFIMLFLLVISLISWTVIYQRAQVMRGANKDATAFETSFWSGIDLGRLYEQQNLRSAHLNGLAQIFYAGFKEFARLAKQTEVPPKAAIDVIQRNMRAASSRELDKLEKHLSFLATVGSVSPYVGLLGTVWGIMHAFVALADVQQATLNMVAPGIAEALVATAMGLFAAIPAVIAYNRYSHSISQLTNRFDAFQDEFSGILYRQAHVVSKQTHQDNSA